MITKILIANNGIAAVSCFLFVCICLFFCLFVCLFVCCHPNSHLKQQNFYGKYHLCCVVMDELVNVAICRSNAYETSSDGVTRTFDRSELSG